MFNVSPFQIEDLQQITLREFEEINLDREQLLLLACRGITQTFRAGGMIVMFAGYYHIFPKVIEVYMVPSVHVLAFPITVVRELRRYIKSIQNLPIHRIQTLSQSDDQTNKWMKSLGFALEGTLAKYTDDELDFNMWAQVKGYEWR